MKRAFLLLALAGLVAMAGCMPFSISPFYEKKDLTFDSTLLGEWAAGDSTDGGEFYLFEQAGPTSYTMTHMADDRTSQFEAHLFRLEDQLFLDLFPLDPGVELDEMYGDHTVPIHSLFRVEATSPSLKVSTIENGWLKRQLSADSTAPAHLTVDDRILFTVSSVEISAWLSRCMKIEDAFVEPEILTRVSEK